MTIVSELGNRIRKYRKSKGYTQEVLSAKCNLHPTYIGQIERGEKNPSIESIYKICQALDLKITDLFEMIDDFAEEDSETTIPLQIYHMVNGQSHKTQVALLEIVKNAIAIGE